MLNAEDFVPGPFIPEPGRKLEPDVMPLRGGFLESACWHRYTAQPSDVTTFRSERIDGMDC